MGFQARFDKSNKEFRGRNVVKSECFVDALSNDAATHLKTINGSYEVINAELTIYMQKGDTVKEVNYLDIGKDKEATYFIKQKNNEGQEVNVEVEKQLFSQVVVMGQNPKGNFYKCEDGRYIHIDEAQIPAYKKVEVTEDAKFAGPVMDGQFYIGKEDDIENRKYISKVMIGDDIIDISKDENGNSKIKTKPNGEMTVNVNGEDVLFAERELEVDKTGVAILKQSVGIKTTTRYYPPNALQAKENYSKGTKHLEFKFDDTPVKVLYVSDNRNEAIIEYRDGHKEIYLTPGKEPRRNLRLGPNDKVFRVDTISAMPVEDREGYQGWAYDIGFSGKVEVDKKDFNTIINDFHDVKDIVWEFDDEKKINVIKSYKIGNETVTDITWEKGEIKSFTIKNEGAEPIVVKDIHAESTGKYGHLLIKPIEAQEIKEVKFNDKGDKSTVSFKMGAIEIRDAEIIDGKEIGECTVIYQGRKYKTNLQKDQKFKQLALEVQVKIRENVIPLAPSKLYEKKDNKYELVADVVQQGPLLTDSEIANLTDAQKAELCNMSIEDYSKLSDDEKSRLLEQGVCEAHNLTSVDDALKQQEKFRKKPFKTAIIDDKNPDKVHELKDFENRYEGISDFELDPKIIPNIVGNSKINIINGKAVIDFKDTNETLLNMLAFSLGVCGWMFPIGPIIGAGALVATGVGFVSSRVYRAIKQFRINHMSPEKLAKKMQKNAKKLCLKNIRKYDKELRREVKRCKELSGAQYLKNVAKLKREYRFKCQNEIGKLQILSNGTLKVPFNLAEKSKLTSGNLLGFVTAKKQVKEFCKADKNQIKTSKKAYRKDQGLTKKDEFNKEAYKEWKKERKTRAHIEQYGSIRQKLKLYKGDTEYKSERSLSRRRTMLKNKKNALLADARVAKPVQFKERTDRKGNPLCDMDSNAMYSHVAEVEETVENKRPSRAKYKQKTNRHELFVDNVCHKINTTAERRCAYDAKIGKKALEKVEELTNGTKAKVEIAKQEAENVAKGNDFEKSFAARTMTADIKNAVNAECDIIDSRADNANFVELNTERRDNLKSNNTDLRVEASKACKKADQACDSQRSDYQKQVQAWARADYVKSHRSEFSQFAKTYLSKKENRDKSPEAVIGDFIESCKNGPKGATKDERRLARERVDEEMRGYEVVNNVEELVRADVVCSQEQEAYAEWVNKYNADNGAKLDANSDLARSKYYASRKSEDINVVNQFDAKSDGFRESSMEACHNAAQQRMMDGTLVTSASKQSKADKLNTEIQQNHDRIIERQKEEAKEASRSKGTGMGMWDRVQNSRGKSA